MKVLMIGPDRSVHGGISGVVNNYYDAGLDRLVDLRYIGTMTEGSKPLKLLQAVKAYVLFLACVARYDIVHVNRKTVIHQHGGNFPDFYEKQLSAKGRKRVKKVLMMGDAFLVLGMAWRDFFGTIIGSDRITVLPNAVRIPEHADKQYGAHRLLYMGRLCQAKGIGELLDAMPRIREKYPDARLYLAGIWEDRTLQDKAQALGDLVIDLGWISGEEKQRYLRACDIFVLPSYFEGQPVSVLEAMANSCAVVASRTGGIPDMIIEGSTGLLIEPRNTESLAEALLTLLADPGLCRRLGTNARRKAQAEYSIDSNMKQLLAIYESIS